MRTNSPKEQAANFKAMDDCTAQVHVFQPVFELGNPKPVSGKCIHCGGTVSRASMNWFGRGLLAGARHPEAALEALPDWLR